MGSSDNPANAKSYFDRLIGFALFCYYRLLQATVEIEDRELEGVRGHLAAQKPIVLATPHTILLPVVLAMKGIPSTFLASPSRDGGLIADILQRVGFSVVRGSSSRGGVAGLAAMARAVQPGRAVGLTFDGPKGPPLVPKPGIALLMGRAPQTSFALFVTFRPRCFGLWPGYVTLGSWDRFHLVLPFASFAVECVPLSGAGSGSPAVSSGVPPKVVADEPVRSPQDLLTELESLSRSRMGPLYEGWQRISQS